MDQLASICGRRFRRRLIKTARQIRTSASTLKNTVLNQGKGSARLLVASIAVMIGNTEKI